MKNLTIEEISESKNFKEFCEFNNFSLTKIINNLGSSFAVELLDEDDEEYENADANYPYQIFNPLSIDINKD